MATYYISTSGDDSTGSGTSVAPWATFAKFLSSSASGDTCICAAGAYTFATATVANRTVQAATGAIVIFDGAAAQKRWTMSGTVNLIDLRFTNIAGGTATDNAIFVTPSASLTLTVTRCTFYDLDLRGTGDGGLFGTGDNVDAFTRSFTFVGCLFDTILIVPGTVGTIAIFGQRRSSTTYTLTNCVVYLPTSVDNITRLFSQNVSGSNTVIMSNVIVMADGWTLPYGSASGGSTLLTCCFYSMSGVPSGTGVITSDPLFVDAASGVFDLRPTSPCLNAGTLV